MTSTILLPQNIVPRSYRCGRKRVIKIWIVHQYAVDADRRTPTAAGINEGSIRPVAAVITIEPASAGPEDVSIRAFRNSVQKLWRSLSLRLTIIDQIVLMARKDSPCHS